LQENIASDLILEKIFGNQVVDTEIGKKHSTWQKGSILMQPSQKISVIIIRPKYQRKK
jgi:hypothetical protein